jgi:hypothetical protein
MYLAFPRANSLGLERSAFDDVSVWQDCTAWLTMNVEIF